MAQKKYAQPRLFRLHEIHERTGVIDVIRKSADVEPLAVRLPSATQIHRIHGQPIGCELLTSPCVVATVSIESGDDRYHAANRTFRTPCAHEEVQASCSFDSFFRFL